MRKLLLILLSFLIIAALVGVYFLAIHPTSDFSRSARVMQWIRNPQSHPEWTVSPNTICNDALFSMPTSGFIGYLWDDSFKPGHRHQGIDIFAGTDPGVVPVYAAYDGYLTRQEDWKSTIIIRIPSDPLQPGRQIWTYYTHLADVNGNSLISADFPPGTNEIFVKAGTRLGYQGNYSGTPGSPVGVHLHFSIVRDDGSGKYLNELEINNTLDPSPYLGLNLNANNSPVLPVVCGD